MQKLVILRSVILILIKTTRIKSKNRIFANTKIKTIFVQRLDYENDTI